MAPTGLRSGFLVEDKGRERRELCEQIDALQVAKAKAAAAEEFREAAALKKQVAELQAKLADHDAKEEALVAARAAEAAAEAREIKRAEAKARAEAEALEYKPRVALHRSFETRLTVHVPVSAAFAFTKSLEGIAGAGSAPRIHLGPGQSITHYASGLAQLTELVRSELVENAAVAFRITIVKPKFPGLSRLEAAQMVTTVEPFRAWPFYRFKTMWRLRECADGGSEHTQIERAIADFHQYELQDFDAFQAVVRAMEAENETILSAWPAAHAADQATQSAQPPAPAQPTSPLQAPSRRAGRFSAALASRPAGVQAPIMQPTVLQPAAGPSPPVERLAGPVDVLVRHATEDAELLVSVSSPAGGEPTFYDVRSALEAILAGASAEAAVPSGRRPRIVTKRDGVYKGVKESDGLNGVREVVVLGVSLRTIAAVEGRT